MSAWDDGHAAGKAQRAAGGIAMLDPYEVREQAETATDCADDADEWLFGFYEAVLKEGGAE